MKKYIHGFILFASTKWIRFTVCILYPACALILSLLMSKEFIPLLLSLMGTLSLLGGVEHLISHELFGGIAHKDTQRLEYIKTSPYGMSLLKSGITADFLRRTLTIGVILAICYTKRLPWPSLCLFIFGSLFLLEVTLLCCRFTTQFQWIIGSISVLYLFYTGLATLVTYYICPIIIAFLTIACWLGISYLGRYIILRNIRRSFYA